MSLLTVCGWTSRTKVEYDIMAHRFNEIVPTHHCTKEEVQEMIDTAIRKHNRNASIISMWLGGFCLGAFADGLLRMIGKLPPFMGIDISVL